MGVKSIPTLAIMGVGVCGATFVISLGHRMFDGTWYYYQDRWERFVEVKKSEERLAKMYEPDINKVWKRVHREMGNLE